MKHDDDDDHDHDHVNGATPRLWTAVTKKNSVHPPGDIWAWIIVVEWYRKGKRIIRPPEASDSHTSSLLVAKQKELVNLALQSIFAHTCRVLWYAVKFYDMGPTV
jgi:hypothetical protein